MSLLIVYFAITVIFFLVCLIFYLFKSISFKRDILGNYSFNLINLSLIISFVVLLVVFFANIDAFTIPNSYLIVYTFLSSVLLFFSLMFVIFAYQIKGKYIITLDRPSLRYYSGAWLRECFADGLLVCHYFYNFFFIKSIVIF